MARQIKKRPVRMWIGELPSLALRLSYGVQDTSLVDGEQTLLPSLRESVEGTSDALFTEARRRSIPRRSPVTNSRK
jgi:hypothetical protein